jgi:hypothetical protein
VVDTEPEAESDLRRRAAWLLVMLAVVAVLFVVVISALVKTDNANKSSGPGPLDPAASTGTSHSTTPTRHHQRPSRNPSTDQAGQSSTPPPMGTTSCPTSQTCILEGDPGNAIAAINDYRTTHGQPAVPGQVSPQAQTCAVQNGSGCTGGWAETMVSTPDGAEAAKKLVQLGRLLDPKMTSFEVGWAYDPGAKLYYFAIIRND